jgi:phosphohistidine phosphatase
MDIYFLRHASAGESLNDREKDEKRPLDELGVEQCARIGRALAAMDVKVNVMVSSPLTRAMQTAARVATEIRYESSVIVDKALRPEAKYEQFQELLRRYTRKESIVVVGHNPNLSAFLSKMISDESTDSTIELKKGAIAKVEMKGRRPSLHWLLTPKAVKSIQEAATSKSRPKSSRK